MRMQRPCPPQVERLLRPQRVGLFGGPGAGKTTLLAMLYREGVHGRLPGFRLAAADARTAAYLADQLAGLESGQPVPPTATATSLRLHLYAGEASLDLLIHDGPGADPSGEVPGQPVWSDFDALWLVLDAPRLLQPTEGLRQQQALEAVIEQCLADSGSGILTQPTALLITKADQCPECLENSAAWADAHAGLIRHALAAHQPARAGLVAIACSGTRPAGLAELLTWLRDALQVQDEARLDTLLAMPRADTTWLVRAVEGFARRYPQAPSLPIYRAELRQRLRGRRRRRLLFAGGLALGLTAALASYDALGYHALRQFEAEHGNDPAGNLERWQTYQTWHPTRLVFQPGARSIEESRVSELEAATRRFQFRQQLTQLRDDAGSVDPERTWERLRELQLQCPEFQADADVKALETGLKARRDQHRRQRAADARDLLARAEQNGTDLKSLIRQADQFLEDFGDTPLADDMRRRRDAFLHRLEERDIDTARELSARQPFSFATRREAYVHYLDRHPSGTFATEAQAAVRKIDADWDKHDFRLLREQFVAHPGDVSELVVRCRAYLAIHPTGQFVSAATDLLRWSERVTAPGEYRVILREGHFEKRIARFLSRGPDLSVELEVAGIRYGPSNITVNRYDPHWNYEFPRRIRWKLGDPVRIRVTDHDYWDRVVLDLVSLETDRLAMGLLSGEVWSGSNWLRFESDFAMPELPAIE